MQEGPLEVLGEGRLPGDAAGLLDPRRGGDDRLVGATLGAERDARRRADQNRLAAGVDPERPGLEAAHQERVVDRSHRQQRLAVARPGRPELAQQADEVDLRDAELDVLAVVGLAPAHERVRVVSEPVDPVSQRPDPDPVDPAAEVGRRGDVGAHRDHPRGRLGRLAIEVGEQPAELLLGRGAAGVLAAELRRQRGRLDDRRSARGAGARPPPRRSRPRRSRGRSAPRGRRDRRRAARPARRAARR